MAPALDVAGGPSAVAGGSGRRRLRRRARARGAFRRFSRAGWRRPAPVSAAGQGGLAHRWVRGSSFVRLFDRPAAALLVSDARMAPAPFLDRFPRDCLGDRPRETTFWLARSPSGLCRALRAGASDRTRGQTVVAIAAVLICGIYAGLRSLRGGPAGSIRSPPIQRPLVSSQTETTRPHFSLQAARLRSEFLRLPSAGATGWLPAS